MRTMEHGSATTRIYAYGSDSKIIAIVFDINKVPAENTK